MDNRTGVTGEKVDENVDDRAGDSVDRSADIDLVNIIEQLREYVHNST